MREAADKKGIEAKIWAVWFGILGSDKEASKADIILLGPQVSYLKKKMREKVEEKIPISVIDMKVYGTMDGNSALESALADLKDFNNK